MIPQAPRHPVISRTRVGHSGSLLTPCPAVLKERAERSDGDREGRGAIARILLAAAISLGTRAVPGQDQVRNFGDPILVLDTGGHHAPIRSLAFSPDETTLLSAGEDKVVCEWDLGSNPPSPVRTIRPPIFRGAASAIHSIALSPPKPQGRLRLALAGVRIQSS